MPRPKDLPESSLENVVHNCGGTLLRAHLTAARELLRQQWPGCGGVVYNMMLGDPQYCGVSFYFGDHRTRLFCPKCHNARLKLGSAASLS
jgi:hypothetical protein